MRWLLLKFGGNFNCVGGCFLSPGMCKRVVIAAMVLTGLVVSQVSALPATIEMSYSGRGYTLARCLGYGGGGYHHLESGPSGRTLYDDSHIYIFDYWFAEATAHLEMYANVSITGLEFNSLNGCEAHCCPGLDPDGNWVFPPPDCECEASVWGSLTGRLDVGTELPAGTAIDVPVNFTIPYGGDWQLKVEESSGWKIIDSSTPVDDRHVTLNAGQSHSFVFADVPEPCTISLLAFGAVMLRRKRRA